MPRPVGHPHEDALRTLDDMKRSDETPILGHDEPGSRDELAVSARYCEEQHGGLYTIDKPCEVLGDGLGPR